MPYLTILASSNATYPVGEKAKADEEAMNLIKTARTCLDAAIALCGPGIPYGAIGEVIQPLAEARGCAVVKNYTGHGIGRFFHGAPTIYHHKTKKAYGVMKPATSSRSSRWSTPAATGATSAGRTTGR